MEGTDSKFLNDASTLSFRGRRSSVHDYPGRRLKSLKGQIRLLEILPFDLDALGDLKYLPFIDDRLVQCRIFKAYLDGNDQQPLLFNALSYAWGDASQRTDMVVNGKTVSVGANLASALQHLRDYHTAITGCLPLWVDALCINQEDRVERNEQVRMMRDIYRRASRVVPWLGDGDVDTDRLFDLLADEEFRTQVAEKAELRTPFDPSPILASATATVVYDLCDRVWWSRRWILQELLLAGAEPILIIGSKCVKWSECVGIVRDFNRIDTIISATRTFQAATKSLYVKNIFEAAFITSTDGGNRLPGLDADEWETARKQIRERGFVSISSLTFDVSSFARTTSATLSSDYVYALRGLLPQEERDAIQVDYSKLPMQVFHDAMFLVWTSKFSTQKDLSRMVRDMNFRNQSRIHNTPSWIPDLSQQAEPSNFLNISRRWEWKDMEYRLSPDRQTLTLRGIYIDAITEGPTWRVDFSWVKHDRLGAFMPNRDAFEEVNHFCQRLLTRQTTSFNVHDRNKLSCFRIRRECDRQAVVMRTLGKYGFSKHNKRRFLRPQRYGWHAELSNTLQKYERLWHGLWAELLTLHSTKALDDCTIITALCRFTEAEILSLQLERSPEYCVETFLRLLFLRLDGTVVFGTKAGFIGVGPGHLKVGDSIVFPYGMENPLIVRPVDAEHPEKHEYLLIGGVEIAELHDERESLSKAVEDGVFGEIDIQLK